MINIFLPIYNEEKIAKKNILEVYENAKKLKDLFKINIIDDGSTDKTSEICKEFMKEYEEINYLYFKNGPSRRENLSKSFLDVPDNEIICFMDIDLASDITRIEDLVNYIKQGFDISIGSRYKGTKSVRSLKRLIISKTYNSLIKILFGSKIKDHQCGFKAFKSEKIKEIILQMDDDPLFKRGWFWDAEILLRAQKNKLKIKEFPVRWEAGKQSSFDFKRELKIVKYMPILFKKIKRVN
ncbi:MAG TPA: glycosyltransferase [Candidatus Nanoarchaeia archaeon]|nr:glycosyltransferase [Candidatus Nanoarchaeia archaeon]